MAPSAKGKEKVIYSKDSGKRKRNIVEDNDGVGKRRNRAVLQFIEDAAYQVDEDDSSDDDSMSDDNDFEEEDFEDPVQAPFEHVKASNPPRTPKQEQMSEEDFDKMMENRYKPGSGFVAYEEDKYETKNLVDESPCLPSAIDPIIWKVKCTYGRERHSAFCLMQKYLDLKYLGTKLQILSAFALDHVKGFIYIEADKQSYIFEACNGICTIYSTRAVVVPRSDISLLFSPRSKGSGISEGMWARVKNGKYRGDLAQVAAVNDTRKKVTVKLIPRIDLRAMADKFGRGAKVDKTVNPTPRLISSIELEEFRPLIQYRRDRDTNKVFEVLDGMMLKDGYLYKKVSVDSLSLWGVTPTEDELLKFEPSKVDECNDTEWLNQLYGERKKKSRPIICGKGSGKGEGSSSTSMESKFEVHDLVFFGRKEFGVVIGSEKDDTFKIIKDGSEGPVTVTLLQNELRSADFDKKLFTAIDQHGNKISINDTVKVLDGPLKDREGTVKRIYKGIVFLYNETSEENNGYICLKTELCEKLESSVGLFSEKGGGLGKSSFGDSSPKSPLPPQISHEEKDESNKFNNDENAMYSIGQSLRIRVGPLKGYLCRVLAIRRSEVTVKLDSKHKIISVKSEHLSEVRDRNAGISLGGDSNPVKPFEPSDQDGTGDWMAGTAAATATEGGNWNSGGLATERSSWPAFATSNASAQAESSNPLSEVDNKDDSWNAKPKPVGGSSWGAAPAAQGTTSQHEQGSGWGSQASSSQLEANNWNKAKPAEQGNDGWGSVKKSAEETKPWGKTASDLGSQGGDWNKLTGITDGSGLNKPVGGSSWGVASVADGVSSQPEQGQSNVQLEANSWNKAKTVEPGNSGWGSGKKTDEGIKPWGKAASVAEGVSSQPEQAQSNVQLEANGWNKAKTAANGWNKAKTAEQGDSGWGSGKKTDEGIKPWGKATSDVGGQSGGWNKTAGVTDGGNWNSKKPVQNDTSGWGDKSASKKIEGEGGGVSSNGDGGGSSGWGKGAANGSKDDWGGKKKDVDGGQSSKWGGAGGGSWGSSDNIRDGGNEDQTNSYGGDTGGGGNWRGGRGGRRGSDRGRFGGRGDSDRGGYRGRGRSDSGSFGGRGGSDGGGRFGSNGWGKGATDAGGSKDWGGKKNDVDGGSSGWGQSNNKWGGAADGDGGSSVWGQAKGDGGKSSGWGKGAADGGGSKDSWGGKKNDADGGSGWGQSSSKWGGSGGGSETGNADGGWGKGGGGSKDSWGGSKWAAGNASGNEDQTNSFGGDTGRGGGNWRGGRGGRRGGSDRGGFGGRGDSERGGYGGRNGSDQGGGFRGRGGSDRGSFRGRGGFGDRGGGRGRSGGWSKPE